MLLWINSAADLAISETTGTGTGTLGTVYGVSLVFAVAH
jgi:hypothetical protein